MSPRAVHYNLIKLSRLRIPERTLTYRLQLQTKISNVEPRRDTNASTQLTQCGSPHIQYHSRNLVQQVQGRL